MPQNSFSQAALWLGQGNTAHARRWLLGLLATTTIASLLIFNRDADLDRYGIFFFGSYGLGMLAAWAVAQRREVDAALLAAGLVGIALTLQYRERLWVTLATVAFLLVAPRVKTLPAWLDGKAGQFFQQSSYAVFLVHYPLAIMLFAVIDRMFLMGTLQNLTALALCWATFMAAAWCLMRSEVWVYDTLPSLMERHASAIVQHVRAVRA